MLQRFFDWFTGDTPLDREIREGDTKLQIRTGQFAIKKDGVLELLPLGTESVIVSPTQTLLFVVEKTPVITLSGIWCFLDMTVLSFGQQRAFNTLYHCKNVVRRHALCESAVKFEMSYEFFEKKELVTQQAVELQIFVDVTDEPEKTHSIVVYFQSV